MESWCSVDCLTLIQMEFWVILWEEMKDGLADGCCVVYRDYEYLPQSCLLH